MTDKLFLQLNKSTRITYDARQWIIQTQAKAGSDWKSKHFIATSPDVLQRVLDEMGIQPTQKAQQALGRLPESFQQWYTKHS
jgi:hypothetical protein